jgi:hypothetical protein
MAILPFSHSVTACADPISISIAISIATEQSTFLLICLDRSVVAQQAAFQQNEPLFNLKI